jgi:hypothetical protein
MILHLVKDNGSHRNLQYRGNASNGAALCNQLEHFAFALSQLDCEGA